VRVSPIGFGVSWDVSRGIAGFVTLTRVFGEMQTYPELIRPLVLPFF
jgi:hypothetical protein